MSESSIPTAMQWRFKTIRKLLKETVPMTPNNGQATVKPGQRISVDLPFNYTVDLSTFTWFCKGQTKSCWGWWWWSSNISSFSFLST